MECKMKNQFVMPYEGGWAVKGSEAAEITAVYDTKEEAIEAAKEIAMGDDSGIVVLREDGTIDNLNAYSIDPFPSDDNTPDYNTEQDEDMV